VLGLQHVWTPITSPQCRAQADAEGEAGRGWAFLAQFAGDRGGVASICGIALEALSSSNPSAIIGTGASAFSAGHRRHQSRDPARVSAPRRAASVALPAELDLLLSA
jgi:hypothetical protein